jgi:hypothetical protein
MGRVGLVSRATGTLACLAAGLRGLGSSALPLADASVADAADENAYRFPSWPFYLDREAGASRVVRRLTWRPVG